VKGKRTITREKAMEILEKRESGWFDIACQIKTGLTSKEFFSAACGRRKKFKVKRARPEEIA